MIILVVEGSPCHPVVMGALDAMTGFKVGTQGVKIVGRERLIKWEPAQ